MVGDIVWAPFPLTSPGNTKVRPVLVVADVRDGTEDDWIVCEITSSPLTHTREIEITRNDMTWGGLRRASKVRPDRLTTLNQSVFQDTAGHLADAKLAEISTAIRGLF